MAGLLEPAGLLCATAICKFFKIWLRRNISYSYFLLEGIKTAVLMQRFDVWRSWVVFSRKLADLQQFPANCWSSGPTDWRLKVARKTKKQNVFA